MATIKIHGGDFLPGDSQYMGGYLFLRTKNHSFVGEKIPLSKVASVELLTQENVKNLGGTVAWSAVGALVAGPLGLVAGALVGGNKSSVTFLLSLDDGRAAVASSDSATHAALIGAALTRQQAAAKQSRAQTPDHIESYLDSFTPPKVPESDDTNPLSFLQ